jgi:hypothetical protein
MSAGPPAHDTVRRLAFGPHSGAVLAGVQARRDAVPPMRASAWTPAPRRTRWAAVAGRSMPVVGVGRRGHGSVNGRCPVQKEAWMSPEIRIQEAS